ncbi:MAG: DNA polymerase III subunit gamma/tau, partial [Thermoguttaceae bacterium]|nr:DNA polymerase III subunit gamma/tau [Thermoguttaceae bacterium]
QEIAKLAQSEPAQAQENAQSEPAQAQENAQSEQAQAQENAQSEQAQAQENAQIAQSDQAQENPELPSPAPAKSTQTASILPAKPAKSEKTPSAYQVVARRYRPQAFDELIGQETVARALSNAIETNRVGHAYLFTGARGVGKTSCARIFAKALNCVDGPTVRPCLTCDSCVAVSTGDDVDVIEIDGASNRGVDEIRQLRQNATIAPSRSLYKIYIIDEVHMLTREAFNALLKTLEEPPARVKFVFCTTEPNKIPITILSRCQRFDFSGIASGSIAERLAQIAAQEGAEAENGVFEILARRANGSMRDAQSLLEQLLSFAPTYISQADARGMLGSVDDKKLFDILDATVAGNCARVFEIVADAAAQGVDFGVLVEQTLGVYRDLMVVANGCGARELMYSPVARLSELQEIAAAFGIRRILASLQILDQTAQRMRFSAQSRVLAELAFARLCLLDSFQALETLIERLRAGTLPEFGDASAAPSSSAALPPVSSETDGKKKNNVLTSSSVPPRRRPDAPPSSPSFRPQAAERPDARPIPTPDAPPFDEEPPYFLAESGSFETEIDVSDALPPLNRSAKSANSTPTSRFVEPPRSFQPPPVVPRVLPRRPTYQTEIDVATPPQENRDKNARSTPESNAVSAPWLGLSTKELANAWLDATRGLGCILPTHAATFCSVAAEAPDAFVVCFPGSKRQERDYCEREKEKIGASLAQRLGGPVSIRCLLDPTKTDAGAGFNGSAESNGFNGRRLPSNGAGFNGSNNFNGGRESSNASRPAPTPGVRDLYRRLSQNEVVVELRELFEAELAEVKPPRSEFRR